MKIDSGRETFEFDPGPDGRLRAVILGVVAALRAALGREDEPQTRWAQLDRLRGHVRGKGLDLEDGEADNLLDALLEIDRKKKAPGAPPTSPTSTTSTPSH
jgi:hypothetical protein